MPMFYGKEYDICIRFTCSRNWLAAREWAGNFFPGQHRGHRKFRVEGAEHQAISFQQGHGALNGKGNRNALVHQGGDVGNDIIGGKEIQLGKRHAKPGLQFPLDGAAVGGDEGGQDQILPHNVGFARQRVV